MRKTLILAAVALVAAACAKEKVETSVPGKVSIVPVITRATDVNFEDGDAIGVNIVRGEESHALYQEDIPCADVYTARRVLFWQGP